MNGRLEKKHVKPLKDLVGPNGARAIWFEYYGDEFYQGDREAFDLMIGNLVDITGDMECKYIFSMLFIDGKIESGFWVNMSSANGPFLLWSGSGGERR